MGLVVKSKGNYIICIIFSIIMFIFLLYMYYFIYIILLLLLFVFFIYVILIVLFLGDQGGGSLSANPMGCCRQPQLWPSQRCVLNVLETGVGSGGNFPRGWEPIPTSITMQYFGKVVCAFLSVCVFFQSFQFFAFLSFFPQLFYNIWSKIPQVELLFLLRSKF